MNTFTTLRNSKFTKFIFFVLLIVGVLYAVQTWNIGELLDPEAVKSKIEGMGAVAPLAYILIYVVSTVLLLPSSAVTVTGGAVFGSVMGTIYTVVGATIGATISFLIARYFGEKFVEKILKNKFQKIYEYDEKIEQNGFMVMFFLRLIPIVPFNILNYAMGLTRIRFKDYLIATFIGIIPGTFVYTFFGSSLSNMNPVHIIIAIVLLLALMSIMPIYNHFKKN